MVRQRLCTAVCSRLINIRKFRINARLNSFSNLLQWQTLCQAHRSKSNSTIDNHNNDCNSDNKYKGSSDRNLIQLYSDISDLHNTSEHDKKIESSKVSEDDSMQEHTNIELDNADVAVELSMTKEAVNFFGKKVIQSLQREQPPRGSGIQPLLDYNKQWAYELAQLNPRYFAELAKQQRPQYLWIGCSDSRVPANEIVGLYPGDVFVHRNVANVVCSSDLNALAVIQYAVDCLKVEHVIVAGHYKCGGVTAALNDSRVGLADHWILHVSSVKKRHWRRMMRDIPTKSHLDALCELNVLAQMEHIVESHIIQRVWSRQNAEDLFAQTLNKPIPSHTDEVEIHGWIYELEDGLIRPLITLNRHSNADKEISNAVNAVFYRHSQM